jgi:hypothetical protein
MAQSVYSTRFLAIAISSSDGEYEVPSGFVAVVRDVDAWSSGGIIVNWRVSISGDPAFAGGQFTVEALDQFTPWRGRVIVNAGETIQAITDGPRGLTVCGYLLTLP